MASPSTDRAATCDPVPPLSVDALTRLLLPLAQAFTPACTAIAWAESGQLTSTDGRTIFLRRDATAAERRLEVAIQAALAGAGSLDPEIVAALIGTPERARRYLAFEITRLIAAPGTLLNLVAGGRVALAAPVPLSSMHAFRLSARRDIAVPFERAYGTLRPLALLRSALRTGGAPDKNLELQRDANVEIPELDDDEAASDVSKWLPRLLRSPLGGFGPLSRLFAALLDLRRMPALSPSGAGSGTALLRQGTGVATAAAVKIPASGSNTSAPPGVPLGLFLYPEWDEAAGRYKPGWCSVHELSFRMAQDYDEAPVPSRDRLLTDAIHRFAPSLVTRHRLLDGDEFDTDEVLSFAVDLRCAGAGRAFGGEAARVYKGKRRMGRDFGLMTLLDVSQSSDETGVGGHSVSEQQRRAAGALGRVLAASVERTALCAFHSAGRHATRFVVFKDFDEPLTETALSALSGFRASGLTRLGAALRHAVRKLTTESGYRENILIVISDGYPYDYDYADAYAVHDVARALGEARDAQVGILWLSMGLPHPAMPEIVKRTGHRWLADTTYQNIRSQIIPDLARAYQGLNIRTGRWMKTAKTKTAGALS